MLILEAKDLVKYYADRQIFKIDRLTIFEQDRIGLVGLNGAGKSTLLDVLTGSIRPDRGTVEVSGRHAYISQLDRCGQYSGQTLSGGEISKRKIEQVFARDSTILFADEPTASLDMNGIRQFEKRLQEYRGAVVLVSHDRELLDRICNAIYEIERGCLKQYRGNYSAYLRQKEHEKARQQQEYDDYMRDKRKLERAMEDVKRRSGSIKKTPARMGNSEARLHKMGSQKAKANLDRTVKALSSRLERLAVKDKPRDMDICRLEFKASARLPRKAIITAESLNKSFGQRVLLEDTGFQIYHPSKVAILGDNGCGKTTLVKMLVNRQDCIWISGKVKMGYYAQDCSILDQDQTVIDNMMQDGYYPETFVRTVLARLLFKGRDVYKKVSVLSGGERTRAALARIVLSDANVLVLDEPTNHLDIYSMEALEDVLKWYDGTIIFVSHDRRFIDSIATRLIVFDNKKLVMYEGNCREYFKSRSSEGRQEGYRERSMVLENRLAEIIGRISTCTQEQQLEELDREYRSLLDQLRESKADDYSGT